MLMHFAEKEEYIHFCLFVCFYLDLMQANQDVLHQDFNLFHNQNSAQYSPSEELELESEILGQRYPK